MSLNWGTLAGLFHRKLQLQAPQDHSISASQELILSLLLLLLSDRWWKGEQREVLDRRGLSVRLGGGTIKIPQKPGRLIDFF